MKTNTLLVTVAILGIALLLHAPHVLAQAPAPEPSASPTASASPAVPAPSNPGPKGGGDRIEQFRQRMNEFLKVTLKVSDEEWAVIQPLLEKVQTKQRESLTSRFSFMAGRRGGDHGGRTEPAASAETDALRAALESESTSPAEIKAKLEAVREARKKSEADLAQAREDLRKVLTQRQEATLVMVGILE